MKKGFTLIELLVVISIIGLLSSIVLSSLSSARAKARDGVRVAEIKQIMLALMMYQDNNGSPLNTSGQWFCLGHGDGGRCWKTSIVGSTAIDNALSPYMSKIPDDPTNDTSKFGDAYLYNSSYSDATTYASQGFIFSNTPVLQWGIENCTPSKSACAGGAYGSWGAGNGPGCGNYCVLPVQSI